MTTSTTSTTYIFGTSFIAMISHIFSKSALTIQVCIRAKVIALVYRKQALSQPFAMLKTEEKKQSVNNKNPNKYVNTYAMIGF